MHRFHLVRLSVAVLVLAVFSGCLVGVRSDEAAPPEAAAPEAGPIDVRQFGAVGDGKADDTQALQRALDAAAYQGAERTDPLAVRTGRVVLPEGHYRITAPLKLTPAHKGIVIEGCGGMTWFGGAPGSKRTPFARTQVIYDGPEGGSMIDIRGINGMEIRNLGLLGMGKAGVLVKGNSPRGHATGRIRFQRVLFIDGGTGVEFGGETATNGDTSYLVECFFRNLDKGFVTRAGQNVLFTFVRCDFMNVGTCWHAEKGGAYEAMSCFARSCPLVIRIDEVGVNNGTFHFSNLKVEPILGKNRGRATILKAGSEAMVVFTSLNIVAAVATQGEGLDVPAFDLGPSALVTVTGSQISGKVATLRGKPDAVPTYLTFDSCRFRVHADPRKTIDLDEHSGYEVRNSTVVADVQGKPEFLRRVVKGVGE